MATSFEDIWYPRIGQEATHELRRFRRRGYRTLLAPWLGFAGGALAADGSSLPKTVGWVLILAAALLVNLFLWGQRRLSAAISSWYGLDHVSSAPKMTPARFDQWRKANRFLTPEERELEAAGQPPEWARNLKPVGTDYSVPPPADGPVFKGRPDQAPLQVLLHRRRARRERR